MKTFIKIMKALSDPNRVKTLKMLERKNDMCVCEIQAALGVAQPTVSKHMKILEDAGLVESFKEKLWVNYRLSGQSNDSISHSMLTNLHGWLNDTPEILKLQEKLPVINRENICKIEKY